MKSVFCIIVTYNGAIWIRKCLDSLLHSSYPLKIIVVDNASSDQTVKIIRDNYPIVTCVESRLNLGFGQGNNIGLKMAVFENADFVFLLNQDARVEENTISSLVQAFEKNPGFGILSPIHLNGSGKTFDKHFSTYLAKSDIKNLKWENLNLKQKHETIIQTSFVNAAAWLVSAACFVKTGGFDPIFFHYGEDDHYAQRALYHEFKIGIVPNTFICHERETGSESQQENPTRKIYKDWIFFLTHACNINHNYYKMLMIKRGSRYSLQWLVSLFSRDKYKRLYNLTLARNIFTYIPKVKKSREICMHETSPYLNDRL